MPLYSTSFVSQLLKGLRFYSQLDQTLQSVREVQGVRWVQADRLTHPFQQGRLVQGVPTKQRQLNLTSTASSSPVPHIARRYPSSNIFTHLSFSPWLRKVQQVQQIPGHQQNPGTQEQFQTHCVNKAQNQWEETLSDKNFEWKLTGGPGRPCRPVNPLCPFCPLSPASPVSPLSPRGPWGPCRRNQGDSYYNTTLPTAFPPNRNKTCERQWDGLHSLK